MARFASGKAPFLRMTDDGRYGTGAIQRDFLIALVPLVLFAFYKNGIQVYLDGNITFLEMFYPLVFILCGGLTSTVLEGLFFYVTDKSVRTLKALGAKLSTSFAMIPGLLLAMILPLYTPIWVLIFGCIAGTLVGKMLFGGFGYNTWNPALIGYAAIAFTLYGVINDAGGALNASEVLIDAAGGATPLGVLASANGLEYATLVAPYGNLWNFFLGTVPGALAETSALACLVAYAWLVARKVIKWFVPVLYVGTVFVLSWLIGIVAGETGIWFPLYSILSGGLMFGAVLMATEPVTTPRNPLGKVFFALFLGVFTVLFRFVGSLPEGVATAILFMNIFTMPIDNWTAIIRVEGVNKKTLVRFAVLVVLILLIALYGVLKAGGSYTAVILSGIGGLFR
jgi:electron transport complex protein RnfD